MGRINWKIKGYCYVMDYLYWLRLIKKVTLVELRRSSSFHVLTLSSEVSCGLLSHKVQYCKVKCVRILSRTGYCSRLFCRFYSSYCKQPVSRSHVNGSGVLVFLWNVIYFFFSPLPYCMCIANGSLSDRE